MWTNIKQLNGVSRYFKRWKIAGAFALSCTSFIVSAAGASGPTGLFSAGDGVVWQASVSGTATGRVGGASFTSPGLRPWIGTITDTVGAGISLTNCMANNRFGWSSDDAIIGLIIGPDIILAMTSGTVTGAYAFRTSAIGVPTVLNGSGAWSAMGIAAATGGVNILVINPWCFGLSAMPNNAIEIFTNTGNHANISGTFQLYIGPNAVNGTYSVPQLFAGRVQTGVGDTLLTASSFQVGQPSSCSMSFADANVDFGNVIKSTDMVTPLASFNSQLSINCSSIYDGGSGTGVAAMALSFEGTQGRTTDTLALRRTGATSPLAEVRGSFQQETTPCSTGTSSIQFNATATSINLSQGTTNVPLIWTLCNNGSDQYGVGTAQVTATLTWP